MRVSLARVALAVFSTLLLTACSSSRGPEPGWSFSRLNPFASRDAANAPPFIDKPSSLASPTVTTPSDSSYATSTSDMNAAGGIANAGSSGFASSSRAGHAPGEGSVSPAVPQQGRYDTGASYRMAGGAPDAPAAGQGDANAYDWLSGSNAPAAAHAYASEPATGPYGNSAPTARYDAASDRYGLGADSTQAYGAPYGGPTQAVDPYAGVATHNDARYGAVQEAGGSRNDSPPGYADSDSRYSVASYPTQSYPSGRASSSAPHDPRGASYPAPSDYGYGQSAPSINANPPSLVGDRYASAARSGGAVSGEDRYAGGGSPSDWNPGGPTQNMPGQSDYEPGNTGYQPPGVSPYRPTGSAYAPPGSTSGPTTPYQPGSIRPYSPPSGLGGAGDSPGTSSSGSAPLPSASAPYPGILR